MMKKNKLYLVLCIFLFILAFTMVLFCSDNKLVIIGGSSVCSYEKDDMHIIDKAGWSEYIDQYINDFNITNFSKENALISEHKENGKLTRLLNSLDEKDAVIIQLEKKDYKNETLTTDIEYIINSISNADTKKYLILPHYLDTDKNEEMLAFATTNNIIAIDPNIYILSKNKNEEDFLFSPYKDRSKGYDYNGFNYIYAQAFAEAFANALNTGTFNWEGADCNITRGMFVNDILRFAEIPIHKGSLFSDVEATYEYADAIATAKAMGIVSGDNNGNFRPDDIISVGDGAVITANLLEKSNYFVSDKYSEMINTFILVIHKNYVDSVLDTVIKRMLDDYHVERYALKDYFNMIFLREQTFGICMNYIDCTEDMYKNYAVLAYYNLAYSKLR